MVTAKLERRPKKFYLVRFLFVFASVCAIFYLLSCLWLTTYLLLLFSSSNGSVVPSMLIKIDTQAQIDQRQLVDFINTTLKSGTLGKYQVDPSSVQTTGTVSIPFLHLFFVDYVLLFFFLLCFHQFDFSCLQSCPIK